MKRFSVIGAVLVIAPLMLISPAAFGFAEPGSAGLEALDYAFRFASAIKTDEKDRSRGQEVVVGEFAELGAFDEAARRADLVDGWRRGVSYADLARSLAKAGQSEQARVLIAKAEKFRPSVQGWQNPRISAHIAQASIEVGDLERGREIFAAIAANDRDYIGQSAAWVATGHAARGEYEIALEVLAAFEGENDLYDAWWRTAGYVAVARRSNLSGGQRLAALDLARRSADGIDGWMRAESLESIADEYTALGAKQKSQECLDTAERILAQTPETLATKAPLLANLARAWAAAGAKARARNLLRQAAGTADRASIIDRPAIHANIAATWMALGDPKEARSTFDFALREAGKLTNARPRAIAIVGICRWMGRSGVALDPPTRARLDELFGGLKDPW